jgi:mRNA-degrading endonuclease HigB of HigAB toxin-antitoxin module
LGEATGVEPASEVRGLESNRRQQYRIVVWINYPYRVVYVRFIGTHRQYDEIDAQTV